MVNALGEESIGASGLSAVGAVVGATRPEHIARLRDLMPSAIFLLPGVGAQGGTVETLGAAFSPGPAAGLVTASRAIVDAHARTGEEPASAAAAAAEDLPQRGRRAAAPGQAGRHAGEMPAKRGSAMPVGTIGRGMEHRARSPLRFVALLALIVATVVFLAVIAGAIVGGDEEGESTQAAGQVEGGGGSQEGRGRRRVLRGPGGDTLDSIATDTGVSVEELQALNPDLDPQSLIAGQELRLRE